MSGYNIVNLCMDVIKFEQHEPGADARFQVRGGALKKIAPSGGRRENF